MECQANGITVSYDLKDAGSTVVFIHALGVDRRIWWQQVPAFAPEFRTLSYDVRGHGASSKPPGPYSLGLFADDLDALLAVLGVGRAHLVGISMGGMIAQHFALRYPERAASLTLVDTTSGYDAAGRQMIQERAAAVEAQGIASAVEATLERWFTASFRQQHPAPVDRVRRMLLAADPLAYASSARAVAGMQLTAELSRIACPSLVIVGEKDSGTPPEMARIINTSIPHSRLLVIPSAAHLSPVEQPGLFNAEVTRFLKKQ